MSVYDEEVFNYVRLPYTTEVYNPPINVYSI